MTPLYGNVIRVSELDSCVFDPGEILPNWISNIITFNDFMPKDQWACIQPADWSAVRLIRMAILVSSP